MRLLYVLIGGAIGSLLRYLVSGFVQEKVSPTFPWGTLAVNLLGCFLIGFLWEHFEYVTAASAIRTFAFIGILGSFTTFSAFSIETINLLRDKDFLTAAINIFANNFFGLALCFGGYLIARHISNFIR